MSDRRQGQTEDGETSREPRAERVTGRKVLIVPGPRSGDIEGHG